MAGWCSTSPSDLPRRRRSERAAVLGGKKAGHGGTLDPLATGILPLAFGEATKLIPDAMDGDKEYEFTVRWGEARDTDDAEGKIRRKATGGLLEEEIKAALPPSPASLTKRRPFFRQSSCKANAAYDLPAPGKNRSLRHGPSLSSKSSFSACRTPIMPAFRAACGKGVYVRALARDLARRSGTYGHVNQLRRARVGPFRLACAISLEKLEELAHKGAALTALLALKAALDDIPALTLTAKRGAVARRPEVILIGPQHGDTIKRGDGALVGSGTTAGGVGARSRPAEFRVVRDHQS